MPTIHITRSSMISAIDYDEKEQLLGITFAKGGRFIYKNVPKQVYNDLLASESVGKYFLANIKNKYEFEKE